jgi:phosphatidylglycerol:prolipoprotein diacylglycerol transferase
VAIATTAALAGISLVRAGRRANLAWIDILKVHGTLAAATMLGAAIYAFIERGAPLFNDSELLLFHGARYPGALLGVLISLPLIARALPSHLSLAAFGDLAVPVLAFALVGVRLGCFMAGCCFGEVSDLPWAVRFPMKSPATLYQIWEGRLSFAASRSFRVHPLQGYFALLALGTGLFLLWFRRRKRYEGQLVLLFLVIHETGKGLLELLRPPFMGGRHLAAVSLLLAGLGLGALLKRGKDAAPTTWVDHTRGT